jgi:hypothetical protein
MQNLERKKLNRVNFFYLTINLNPSPYCDGERSLYLQDAAAKAGTGTGTRTGTGGGD